MCKVKFVSVFMLLALLLSAGTGTVLAGEPNTDSGPEVVLSSATCTGAGTDEQIQALAELISKEQVSEEAAGCYEALNAEGKARLFEKMAEQRGLLSALREETRQDKLAMARSTPQQIGPQQTAPPGSRGCWTQLIEHTYWSIGRPHAEFRYWWENPWCDDDPSDIDYSFAYRFSSQVTDPDALRAYGRDFRVDAMVWVLSL